MWKKTSGIRRVGGERTLTEMSSSQFWIGKQEHKKNNCQPLHGHSDYLLKKLIVADFRTKYDMFTFFDQF